MSPNGAAYISIGRAPYETMTDVPEPLEGAVCEYERLAKLFTGWHIPFGSEIEERPWCETIPCLGLSEPGLRDGRDNLDDFN